MPRPTVRWRHRTSAVWIASGLGAAAASALVAVACGSSFENAGGDCDSGGCDAGHDGADIVFVDDDGASNAGDASASSDAPIALTDAADAAITARDDSGQMDAGAADAGSCGAGTYCALVLATGPVAYFRFEEAPPTGGGPALLEDATGHGFIGSASGAYSLGARPAKVGPGGHGLRLDGGTVTITAPTAADAAAVDLSFPSKAPFSISGWFDLDSLDGGSSEFGSKTLPRSLEGYIVYVGNFLGFEARDTNNSLFSYVHEPASDMPTTVYAHVAFTWDGTVPTMYINGSPLPSQNTGTDTSKKLLSDEPGTFSIMLLAGSVDEYALYNRTLTQADVSSLAAGP